MIETSPQRYPTSRGLHNKILNCYRPFRDEYFIGRISIDSELRTRIEDLAFSTPVHNALGAMKVETMLELVKITEHELMLSPNLVKKSLSVIKHALAMNNISVFHLHMTKG